VVEGSGEAGVVFCDPPTVPAGPVGKFLVTQMAAVAELEAGCPPRQPLPYSGNGQDDGSSSAKP
jgi:hypothetical protein